MHQQGDYSEYVATPDIQNWFTAVDQDNSGQINWQELQKALVNGPGNNFSEKICRYLINLFDRDYSGTINVAEFGKLYNFVNQWLRVFAMFDRDSSGLIDEGELFNAFRQMGYNLGPEGTQAMVRKWGDEKRKVSVENFIMCCIFVQKLTQKFGSKDQNRTGTIHLSYEEFLIVVVDSSIGL